MNYPDYPEVFANVAMKALADAKRAGITMVAHTLTCPDCVRYNDEDMTVKMCDAAKVLNNAYRDAFDIAKPYMAIIEADAQRMNE